MNVHLVAMPWFDPFKGSIQIAALKAYVDKECMGIKCITYSAFFEIIQGISRDDMIDYFNKCLPVGEDLYFLTSIKYFGKRNLLKNKPTFNVLLKRYNQHYTESQTITTKQIRDIESNTIRYIENKIVPNLNNECINLIGFTISFSQIHASIFTAMYLEKNHPQYKYLFLFGGSNTVNPLVKEVLTSWNVRGILILGEGEPKLGHIIKLIQRLKNEPLPRIQAKIATQVLGAIDITADIDLRNEQTAFLRNGISDLSSLPTPDYSEYLQTIRNLCDNKTTFNNIKNSMMRIPIEGTRGCFAKCDFCSVKSVMPGFKSMAPNIVSKKTMEILERYEPAQVDFVDNVCDTWAEQYADTLISNNLRIGSFMELRASHPERFWVKLSLSGVNHIQLGIESLSDPLLKKIGKGVSAMQNLRALKCLKELGIRALTNIITFHPKATAEDISETKRILLLASHYDSLSDSEFQFMHNSRLYDDLPNAEKYELRAVIPGWVPSELWNFFSPSEHYYDNPPYYRISNELEKKWRSFVRWHAHHERRKQDLGSLLTIKKISADDVVVNEFRLGRNKIYHLYDNAAKILDLCHEPMTIERLAKSLLIKRSIIEKELRPLIEKELIVKINEELLSLPTRNRDEILLKYIPQQPMNGSIHAAQG
jgi:radical SAM superfamily enzyme YgiQ (UPF0313 family)